MPQLNQWKHFDELPYDWIEQRPMWQVSYLFVVTKSFVNTIGESRDLWLCTSRLSARREADLPAEYNHFLSTNNVSRFGKYPIKEVYATSRIKDDGQLFGNKSSFIFFFSPGKSMKFV